MAFNGSGTFLINTAGQPVVSGTVISSTAFNALTADLATGLSTVITKDGQTTVTANIPMSTYKFTGLGVGSAATDSANLSQVQSTVTKLLTSVSGADTITAVGAPVVAAYAAGQMFYFVATGDNTGAVTLNIDALGAKAVTRDGSVALAAGDIKSGEVVVVVYDGTRFQVVSQLNSAGDARFANVSIASSLYVGGVSTFVGNAGFSANVSIASALSVGGVAAITGATTIGGNLTLSGGTANGVLYLNGSKVATSGSALTFDGTNLSGTGSIGTTIAGKTAQFDAAGGSIYASFADGTKTWRFGAGIISAGAISLYNATDAVTAFTVDATGNLGIGTSSPSYKLDVQGNGSFTSGASVTNVFVGSAAGNGGATVRFLGSNTQKNWMIGNQFNVNGGLEFTPSTTTGGSTFTTPAMVIDSSGNLGLGETSPATRLHIKGANTSLRGQLSITGASAASRITFYQDTDYNAFFSSSSTQTEIGTASATPVLFYAGNAERARITSDGNLAIGTTGATYRIQSTVASGADREMFLSGVTGVTNGLQINYINSGTALSVKFNDITTTASAANAFLDSGDGNRLYRSTSSIRYKKDVESINHAYADNALNLRPIWYRSKSPTDNVKWSWYGLIAEEVAEIDPRLVHWTYAEEDYDVETVDGAIKKTPKPDAKMVPDGVQYERLSVLLLDVVKRQNTRIEQLEAKFAALETK